VAAGNHVFTVRAKDNHADPRIGDKDVTITVIDPPDNEGAPTVSFTRSGANILTPDIAFTLNVLAEDPDGIASVEILNGTEVVASGTSGSLSFEVEGLSPGEYTFKARVTDKHATDPKITTEEITVEVESAIAIFTPLRDLSGLGSFSVRGQDLLVRSEGNGRIHLSVVSLSGRRVASRSVSIQKGQNSIPMGNLHGIHVVLVSDGKKSRSTRVVFSAGR
jgi:hypothetical protein